MKKIVLIVLAVIILFAVKLMFMSAKLNINQGVAIDASDVIASKFLINKNGWDKWWPGQKVDDNHYRFKGSDFYITKITNGDVYLQIKNNGLTYDTDMSYLAGEEGSVNVSWTGRGKGKTGLFSIVNNATTNRAVSEQIVEILDSLNHFLTDERNTYGYKIYLNHAKDTVLLATSGSYDYAPTIESIYRIIDSLKYQAKQQGATPTNFPMLNVTQTDQDAYTLNVALPINKPIAPAGKTTINHIPKGGNLLVADVRGGQKTIDNALAQMKMYMKDHRLISPAMPFQLLLTDRLTERDTSKWVTKIYYPIF